MDLDELRILLEAKVEQYNTPSFIVNDPISIPKRFSKKQDIEITAFWTAILSWGQRKTIINKASELFNLMDNDPYEFIINHKESDLKSFLEFKHRTFNATDTLYFIRRLREFYIQSDTLETAFTINTKESFSMKEALIEFHEAFFNLDDFPTRTRKHIASPKRNSSCKRINMFLRWMVRSDNHGVDFGIWKEIPKAQLCIPLDVHVHRVATKLGLTKRKQSDWKTLEEIMQVLKKLDPKDPCKYDYALFGIGVMEKPTLH